MFTVNDLLPLAPLESVACTVTVKVPAVVGLPVTMAEAPVAETVAVTPGGSPVIASLYGGAPPYKLAITGLPPGVTATVSATGASAMVTGNPTTAGTFTVTVQATDSKGASGSKSFTVNIAATSLTLGASSPVGGMAGQPYSQCVTVTG